MDDSEIPYESETSNNEYADERDLGREVEYNGLRATLYDYGPSNVFLTLHGFTEVGGSRFHVPWTVVSVDLPGHGKSKDISDPKRYTMQQTVADLLALMDMLGFERFGVYGYSMGGRIALHLAVTAPERVTGLILESSSPGIADPEERAARITSDEALAQRIERDGIPAFVEYWENLPLFTAGIEEPKEEEVILARARVRKRKLENSASGLAASLRGIGTGAQQSLWDRLPELKMPVLLLAGSLDEKFVNIARKMAELLPNATLAIIPGAGHRVRNVSNLGRGDYIVAFSIFTGDLYRYTEAGE